MRDMNDIAVAWPSLSELAENVLKGKHHSIFVFIDIHPDLIGAVDLLPGGFPPQQLDPLSSVSWAVEDTVDPGLWGSAMCQMMSTRHELSHYIVFTSVVQKSVGIC